MTVNKNDSNVKYKIYIELKYMATIMENRKVKKWKYKFPALSGANVLICNKCNTDVCCHIKKNGKGRGKWSISISIWVIQKKTEESKWKSASNRKQSDGRYEST